VTTQFIGASPSAVIGYKQYYRITFDVSGQVLFQSPSAKLDFIYDHMQDSGAFAPLSPNPSVDGDEVMTVDVWTLPAGQSLSLADAVRRLEMVAGGAYQSVRSIQKLSGIGDVTGGADARDKATDATNKQNAEDSLGTKLENLFSGLGTYTKFAVVGLVAYAVITASAGLSLIPSRKRG
jgi:hypothetical protein